MFTSLSDRLTATFKNLRTKGRLSESDVNKTVRDIRMALLDADVALPVVKEFTHAVRERALGEQRRHGVAGTAEQRNDLFLRLGEPLATPVLARAVADPFADAVRHARSARHQHPVPRRRRGRVGRHRREAREVLTRIGRVVHVQDDLFHGVLL